MMKSVFVILFFFLSPSLWGQEIADTLLGVEVSEKREVYGSDIKTQLNTGQSHTNFDTIQKSLYQNFSLAQLIAQQSSVFVKSYGINGIATLSFRGASAAQSAVLWKGVPIMNPSLGVSDISLLNTGLFDNISIQYGSNSALLGSGNVGGALLLEDEPFYQHTEKKYKLRLGVGAGSYGQYNTSINAKYQNKKWSIQWKAFYQYAKNNFEFVNNNNQPETMHHARLQGFGSILSTTFKIDPRQYIFLDFWMQQYERQIPRAMFEESSAKVQDDISYRSLLRWERKRKVVTLFVKASLNQDRIYYNDPISLTNSKSRVWQYYQEAGAQINIQNKSGKSKHIAFLNLPFQYSTFKNFSTDSSQYQSRPAIAFAYQFHSANERFRLNANLREEWVNANKSPLLPGFGMEYDIWNNNMWRFSLRTAVQKTFRIPTLSELYNFPGGNKDLQPEKGWNKEAGYDAEWFSKNKSWHLTHQLTYFNRHISNWIYWIGGAIWTPHNLSQVYSRGITTDNSAYYNWNKKLTLHLQLKTEYVLSTTEQSYLPNDESIGKQIPYVPQYNGQMNMGLTYRHLYFNYNQTYTGYRFTTTDESQYLQPYATGNVQLKYNFNLAKHTWMAMVQIQNIWNNHYFVVAQRPMPGSYFIASINFIL